MRDIKYAKTKLLGNREKAKKKIMNLEFIDYHYLRNEYHINNCFINNYLFIIFTLSH